MLGKARRRALQEKLGRGRKPDGRLAWIICPSGSFVRQGPVKTFPRGGVRGPISMDALRPPQTRSVMADAVVHAHRRSISPRARRGGSSAAVGFAPRSCSPQRLPVAHDGGSLPANQAVQVVRRASYVRRVAGVLVETLPAAVSRLGQRQSSPPLWLCHPARGRQEPVTGAPRSLSAPGTGNAALPRRKLQPRWCYSVG